MPWGTSNYYEKLSNGCISQVLSMRKRSFVLLAVAVTILLLVLSLLDTSDTLPLVREMTDRLGASTTSASPSITSADILTVPATANWQAPDIKGLALSFPSVASIENEALWRNSTKHHPRCPKGRAFIMPTYGPHFEFLITGLAATQHFVIDAHDFHYLVVVSSTDELRVFQSLLQKNGISLPVEVVTLIDVLNDTYPERAFPDNLMELMEALHNDIWGAKVKYQAYKKLYGTIYSHCERTFFVDSEFHVVKPMSFDSMFNDFFARRRFFYSTDQRFGKSGLIHVLNEILGLRDDHLPEKIWFHEGFDWFAERSIVLDMMAYAEKNSNVKRPSDPAKQVVYKTAINNNENLTFYEIGIYAKGGIFEYSIYQIFIWANRKRYPHFEWLWTRQVMSNFFSELPQSLVAGNTKVAPFKNWMDGLYDNYGTLEFLTTNLNRETYGMFLEFVNYFRLTSFRLSRDRTLICKLIMESDTMAIQVVDEEAFPPKGSADCDNAIPFHHQFVG